jgi:hypothetical protein
MRSLILTFAASRVSPQMPPGKPLMKSKMVGTGVGIVVLVVVVGVAVVDVDVLVDVLLVVGMVVGTGAEVDEDVEEVVLMLVVVDEDVEPSSVVLDVEVVVVDVVVGVGSVVDDELGAAVELDVVGCAMVVVVVVGHWQFTHSSGVQNEPAAEPSHCSPGSRNALPQLPPVVEVVDVVVGVTVVDDVVGGATHTWRSRNTRSVFTSRA